MCCLIFLYAQVMPGRTLHSTDIKVSPPQCYVTMQCKGNSVKDHPGPVAHGTCWNHLVLHCLQCATKPSRQDSLHTAREACPYNRSFLWPVASSTCHQLQVCAIQSTNPVHQYCLGELRFACTRSCTSNQAVRLVQHSLCDCTMY